MRRVPPPPASGKSCRIQPEQVAGVLAPWRSVTTGMRRHEAYRFRSPPTQHPARREAGGDSRPIGSASGGPEGGDRPDHVSSEMSSHSSSETIHSRIAELRGRHQPIGRFLPSEIQRRERGRSGSVTEDRQQPHNRIPGSETGRQATGGRNPDTRSGGSGTNGATAQTPSRSRRTRRSSPATKRLGVRC